MVMYNFLSKVNPIGISLLKIEGVNEMTSLSTRRETR